MRIRRPSYCIMLLLVPALIMVVPIFVPSMHVMAMPAMVLPWGEEYDVVDYAHNNNIAVLAHIIFGHDAGYNTGYNTGYDAGYNGMTEMTKMAVGQYAYAHSMFNSAEKFESGYRVQVATAPEFPQVGEPSQFMVRVTDADFQEVDRFTMGIKFFFNGQLVDALPPKSMEGGHWDFEYVWRDHGNHIVEIYLYDMYGDDDGLITYKFNMGTQSPFGYIFIAAITVGAFCFVGVMGYIYLPHIRNRYAGKQRRKDE